MRDYLKYLPYQSEFSHQCATWALNHNGWAKMKKQNRRLAKRKFKQKEIKDRISELT